MVIPYGEITDMYKKLIKAAYEIYYRLPRFMQSIISRIIYHPKFGRGVHCYGWIVFSRNVEIGDYSYICTNHFLGNVKIGKFCCIAEDLSVGLYQHPYNSFSSYQMMDKYSPFFCTRGGGQLFACRKQQDA